MSIKQIDGFKINLAKKLGSGSFGDVFEGINDKTSEKVAVKVLQKSASKRYFYSVDAD